MLECNAGAPGSVLGRNRFEKRGPPLSNPWPVAFCTLIYRRVSGANGRYECKSRDTNWSAFLSLEIFLTLNRKRELSRHVYTHIIMHNAGLFDDFSELNDDDFGIEPATNIDGTYSRGKGFEWIETTRCAFDWKFSVQAFESFEKLLNLFDVIYHMQISNVSPHSPPSDSGDSIWCYLIEINLKMLQNFRISIYITVEVVLWQSWYRFILVLRALVILFLNYRIRGVTLFLFTFEVFEITWSEINRKLCFVPN